MAHRRECPNCGAMLRLTRDRTRAVCEYCGYEFETAYQHDRDMAAQAEKIAYARKRGELLAQEEASSRKGVKVLLGCLGALLVFAGLLTALVILFGILHNAGEEEVIETGFAGMDEATMKRVHERTLSTLMNDMASIPKKDYDLTEENMYFLTAEDTNYLYDVYKGDITRSDGTHMTAYLAVYYKNFHAEGHGEFSSDFVMWQGHYLSAGDYSQLFAGYNSIEDLKEDFAENERTAGMKIESYK